MSYRRMTPTIFCAAPLHNLCLEPLLLDGTNDALNIRLCGIEFIMTTMVSAPLLFVVCHMHRESAEYLQPDTLLGDGINGCAHGIRIAVRIEIEKEHIRAKLRPRGT